MVELAPTAAEQQAAARREQEQEEEQKKTNKLVIHDGVMGEGIPLVNVYCECEKLHGVQLLHQVPKPPKDGIHLCDIDRSLTPVLVYTGEGQDPAL